MSFPLRFRQQRKYSPGEVIASLQELHDVQDRWIFPHGTGRVVHPSWVKNMSLSQLARRIGKMRWAVRNPSFPYVLTALWMEHKVEPEKSFYSVACDEIHELRYEEVKPHLVLARARFWLPTGTRIEVRFPL